MVDINKRAKEVHELNKTWWYDIETGEKLDRNKGELLMLVVSELAEAMEGERKNLMDDHLPHRRMAEVEMADAYIRLLDFAGGFDIEIDQDLLDSSSKGVEKNKGEALLEIVKEIAFVSDGEEENFSWTVKVIMDYCQYHNYDLEGAFQEKLLYNQSRADHKVENRKLENGKKF